jgi:hypothetical protein
LPKKCLMETWIKIWSVELDTGGKLMSVILATQEAEIRRISVWSQPRQIVLETLFWWGGWSGRPWVQAPILQKRINSMLWDLALLSICPRVFNKAYFLELTLPFWGCNKEFNGISLWCE